jgi:hypothetical protein
MKTPTNFLQQIKHTLNIPVCCASVSRCLVALQAMKIPLLLYGLLVVFSSLLFLSGWPTLCSLCADHREVTWFYSSIMFHTNHFHWYLIIELLCSSGCFLDCDWRLACWRYVVATAHEQMNPHWLTSNWFSVGASHMFLGLLTEWFVSVFYLTL